MTKGTKNYYKKVIINSRIEEITEVKNMFAAALKNYGDKILKEGIEKSAHQKAVETAKIMLIEGLDIPMIQRITKLSLDEIDRLNK